MKDGTIVRSKSLGVVGRVWGITEVNEDKTAKDTASAQLTYLTAANDAKTVTVTVKDLEVISEDPVQGKTLTDMERMRADVLEDRLRLNVEKTMDVPRAFTHKEEKPATSVDPGPVQPDDTMASDETKVATRDATGKPLEGNQLKSSEDKTGDRPVNTADAIRSRLRPDAKVEEKVL